MRPALINLSFVTLSLALIATTFTYFNAEKIGLAPSDNAATAFDSQNSIAFDPGTTDIYVLFDEVIEAVLAKVSITNSSLLAPETESQQTEEIVLENTPPAQNLGESIVHITCTQKTSKFTKKVSGSGFFVSAEGAIMTNAHVAQFLLLRNVPGQGTMECSASTGIEGSVLYDIELLYISPNWLLENASLIAESNPKGSGENDFALLYVTGTDDNNGTPVNFPHLPPATNPLPKSIEGETVVLVGFPKSEATGGKNVRTVATTTVKSLYTFGGGNADIISLNPSPLGYSGSSGGPVIDHLGRSIGVISTKATSSTVLHAISMSHIDESMKAETGYDLVSVLQGDLSAKAALFNKVISPILSQILAENLE